MQAKKLITFSGLILKKGSFFSKNEIDSHRDCNDEYSF